MDRVLVLPNECLLANGAIGAWGDLQNDYLPAECIRQCGKVGFMAWTLSADLRTRYRVRGFNPTTTSLDIGGRLKHYHDEALRLVAANQTSALTNGEGGGSAARALKSREAWARWRLWSPVGRPPQGLKGLVKPRSTRLLLVAEPLMGATPWAFSRVLRRSMVHLRGGVGSRSGVRQGSASIHRLLSKGVLIGAISERNFAGAKTMQRPTVSRARRVVGVHAPLAPTSAEVVSERVRRFLLDVFQLIEADPEMVVSHEDVFRGVDRIFV